MAKFRKKPVVIEAYRLLDPDIHPTAGEELAEWAEFNGFTDWQSTSEGVDIVTLEGTMLCRPGDWIIKGVANEFYPCKNDVFEATYEPVVRLAA